MNILIERHLYAPELNKVFIRGVQYKTKMGALNFLSCIPKNECIRAFRERFFDNSDKFYKCAVVEFNYKLDKYKSYSRSASGRFDNYKQLNEAIKGGIKSHNLEGGLDVKVKIRYGYSK